MGTLSKLSVLLPKANEYHKKAQAAGKSVLEAAVAAGKTCLEIKEQVKHGEFESYVEEQADFSVSTAQRYMKLAQGYDEIMERLGPGQATNISITEGIKLLCKAPTRNGGKAADRAAFDQSPITDECPKGGEHAWEEDEETGEEVCGKCHDPRAAHAGAGDADGGGELVGKRAGSDRERADGGRDEALPPAGGYAGSGRQKEVSKLFTKANKLYVELTRTLDEIHAMAPHDIKVKAQHNLTISHMELGAWRKMVEK